ncbi:MAG: T9SS type A sorting domain-containing protein [Bacteroidia bacterium]|nr:T9SS type A sorting domain-containing protein [Bacteroidia bacterium]
MKNKVLKKISTYLSVLTLTISTGSIKAQTALLGMTQLGGSASNFGAAFNYNLNSNTYNANAFNGATNGAQPNGSFIKASNGNIYGMVTYDGGSFSPGGNGYLLQYDANNNNIIPLFNFTGTSGAFPGARPYGALLEVSPGVVYGLTQRGGVNNGGVIFSYTLSTNTYSVLYNFISASGWRPQGTLLKASNGLFYGMTSFGGINNNGVVFSFDASNGTYTKLVDFTGNTGSFMGGDPKGSLIEANTGLLYGLASIGGTNSSGVLFEYNILTNLYTVKYNFTPASGGTFPKGSLLKANNGMLYGLASNGGMGNGVLFEYDMSGPGTYTPKFDFTGPSGLNPGGSPQGSLIQASDGNLYGMTGIGGSLNSGVIFGYNLTSPNSTVLVNFSGNSGNSIGSNATYGNLLEYTLCLAPSISAAQINVSCFGNNNGSATVTATNNAPYTYTWIPSGGNLPTASGLAPGSYTCATTNSCGITMQSFTITEPPALIVNAAVSNPTVCAGNSSTLTAAASGGNGPITYSWVAGPSNSISIVTPITATNYTINVTDANGCISSATVAQWVNGLPNINVASNFSLICIGQTASLTANGANTYTWSNASNNPVIVVSPATTTTYTVSGTDANGCNNFSTFTQYVSTCTDLLTVLNDNDNVINIYPNPFNHQINVSVNSSIKNKLHVFNSMGNMIYTSELNQSAMQIDLKGHPAGIYFIQIGSVTKKIIKE